MNDAHILVVSQKSLSRETGKIVDSVLILAIEEKRSSVISLKFRYYKYQGAPLSQRAKRSFRSHRVS